MTSKRDGAAVALLAAFPCLLVCVLLVSGRTIFWGDLTYIHHPWRALVAESLQAGTLPLWNPYNYIGMPLAGEMQSAVWYPGTLAFYFFSFSSGLKWFHALHYALAGIFAFLWLRKEGLRRAGSLGGALLFMGNGSLVSRLPFLNHLSCLAFLPALLLFRRNGWLLGLACALCFLSGYPTILAGGAVIAFALPLLLGRFREAPRFPALLAAWAGAGMLAVGLGACLLFPALRLSLHTHRGSGGLGLEDALQFAFSLSDWRQWIGPLALAKARFSPSLFWWKTCYLGIVGLLAVAVGFKKMKPRAALGAGLWLAAVMMLTLGADAPMSRWIWKVVPVFHYVRYPGNLMFLAMPVLALVAGAGLNNGKGAWLAALAIGIELSAYAAISHPTMPNAYFTDAGPLVRQLQADLEGRRYLLSPRALEWSRGRGSTPEQAALDLNHRLYGLTNAPFHLRAVGNFGEPLVPRETYDLMDFLYSRPGLEKTIPYLPWADAPLVMTQDVFPADGFLHRDGLWQEYWLPAAPAPARAVWFDERSGGLLPADIPSASMRLDYSLGKAVPFDSTADDRYAVRGRTEAGWVFVSEYPDAGWRFWLNGRSVAPRRALGAFEKFEVPAGEWTLYSRYRPLSWTLGWLLTLLCILGSTGYWYNRTLKLNGKIG